MHVAKPGQIVHSQGVSQAEVQLVCLDLMPLMLDMQLCGDLLQ